MAVSRNETRLFESQSISYTGYAPAESNKQYTVG